MFHCIFSPGGWDIAQCCALSVSPPLPPCSGLPRYSDCFGGVVGGEFQEMRFFSFFEEKDNERERERFMVDGGSGVQFLNKEMKSPFLRFFFNARQAAAASAIAANS